MVIRRPRLWLWALVAVLCPVAASAQESHVSFGIGEHGVTLNARNSTLREILDEWARVGGVKIVNADKLDQRRITLLLVDVAERQALEILLRDIGGFVLSARASTDSGRSQFGSLLVVPAKASPSASAAPTSVAVIEPPIADDAEPDTEVQPLIVGAQRGRTEPAPASAPEPAMTGIDDSSPGRAVQGIGTVFGEAEGLVDGALAATVTPPELRPPTPLQRPSETPDAANPFGRVAGAAKPGAIVSGGPPTGVLYPAVTAPASGQPSPGPTQ